MNNKRNRKAGVAWNCYIPDDNWFVSVPVLIAFCGLAAALRPWNGSQRRFNVIMCLQEEAAYTVYQTAAKLFLRDFAGDALDANTLVRRWGGRYAALDQEESLKMDRAIFLCEPETALDDSAYLFADAVVHVPSRTKRHIQAALFHFGLPFSEGDIELLLSEPWDKLERAFRKGRGPLLAMERLKALSRSRAPSKTPKPEKTVGPKVSDLAGYGPLRGWAHELAVDIVEFRAGRIEWRDVHCGVLISGPPGTGKTMFARALANTCNVPVIYGSAARWQEAGSLDSHLKAMRASFEDAISQSPAILFVDEVDCFGDRRTSDHNSSYNSKAIAGFLELLDGFDRREGVVVVAACNYADALDPAIKRAGRLDRHFEVPLPDRRVRLSILKFHSGITLDGDACEKFSFATEGNSGADIEQLVRDARRVARHRAEPLNGQHILEQLQPVVELSADLARRIAVHEAGHAVVCDETGYGFIRDVKISSFRVEGRRTGLGFVEFERSALGPQDRGGYLDQIAMLLGGIAAELEVFGEFSDGSSGDKSADLNLATELATCLEGSRGMGSTLIVEGESPQRLKHLRLNNPDFRARVAAIMDGELERARSIVRSRRVAFNNIVEHLVERKSISGADVVTIMQRHRFPTVSLAKRPLLNETALR